MTASQRQSAIAATLERLQVIAAMQFDAQPEQIEAHAEALLQAATGIVEAICALTRETDAQRATRVCAEWMKRLD